MKTGTTLKIFLCLILPVFFTQDVHAQDTLVKMNNTRIVAKIIEINPKNIKYKKFNNLEGPQYIIDRRQVSRIIYSNGLVDTITYKKPPLVKSEQPKPDPRATNYKMNNLTIIATDFIFGMGSIGYERILEKGKVSIKVPVSIGFRTMEDSTSGYSPYGSYYPYENYNNNWDQSGYYYKYKIFSVGLEGYYYPGGQGTFRYFIGPALEYGQFNYKYYYSTQTNPTYGGYYKRDRGSYYAFLIKNGMIYQPFKNWNVALNGGAGLHFTDTRFNDSNYSNPADLLSDLLSFELGICIGYKF